MAENRADIYAKEGAEAGACYEAYVLGFLRALKPHAPKMELSEIAGKAFLAYYSHVLDLAFDKYGIPQESAEEYRLCKSCWCDTCAKLSVCGEYPQSDGITPPPCAVCEDKPIMPKAGQPACGKYAPEE
jgi:hypothetical protein